MFFPPLHDEVEFLTGYRGRLAVANNCRSVAQLHGRIGKHFSADGATSNSQVRTSSVGERVDFVGAVAGALAQREDSLLLGHTLWGLTMAFRDRGQSFADSQAGISTEQAPMPRLRNARVWLCPSCVESDIGRTHLSFWHRDHQVPGRYRCTAHGDALRFVDCPALLTKAPHEVMGRAHLPDEQAIMYSDASVAAAITTALLQAFLDGEHVRSRREARLALTERTKSRLGLSGAWAATAELSRILMKDVPRAWISDLLSREHFLDGPQAFVQNIIDQDRRPSSACAYALVAGQVCESFHDAASALGLEAP